jgi:hypothetical protein
MLFKAKKGSSTTGEKDADNKKLSRRVNLSCHFA